MAIVLHQFPPAPGVLSVSPFCCKVHMALRLRGLQYETRNTAFAARVNRFGQLPLLEWDGERINDSTEILRAIDRRTQAAQPFHPPAAADEVHLLEDWADESLYWYGVYGKFSDDEGWAANVRVIRGMVPAPMRPVAPLVARRRMQGLLRAQGLLRRARAQVELEFDRHLDMLDHRLKGRRYLIGDAPTAADLSVVSILTQPNVAHTSFFGQRVARRPELSRYLARLRQESHTEA